MTENPFSFGNPIRDPVRFIGRQAELRQIVNRLRSSAHESTSIVGERRIGKTSLLKHLENRQVAETLGLLADEFCMVYMDFQGLTDITPTRFWQRVLQIMERKICLHELIPEIKEVRALPNFDLFDLEDLFTIISDSGLTVVLLLDEFEYVTQNLNFTTDFFGGLRALAIHHNLPLVTGTRRELVDLCHSDEIKGSPFFNIFANIVLRPFTPDEVKTLIKTYLKKNDIQFSQEEISFVQRLSGGYPLFAQISAHFLYQAKTDGITGDQLTKVVSDNFDQQTDAHFKYMWSRCSESEKITLLAIITLNNQQDKNKKPTIENLAGIHSRAKVDIPELLQRGVIIRISHENLYSILSPNLAQWILREILALPGEEESEASVRDWLKDGNLENAPADKNLLSKFKKKYWPLILDFSKEISLGVIGNIAFEIFTKGIF